jgi:ribonuclease HII
LGNLLTVIGVDEAGYGPRLGPLVLGASAFRLPADDTSLRDLLGPVAARRGPVPVDDSKKIYRAGAGAGTLERTVLSFRALAGGGEVPDRPGERPPWGPAPPFTLPVFSTPEQVDAAREALSGVLSETGVEVLGLETRTIEVAEFNRGVLDTGSKATVLFSAAMDLIEPWLRSPGEVHVHVDRHGGRRHYSELLAARLPDLYHWVVTEERGRSCYRFPREDGDAVIDFVVRGDQKHLSVALASMAAKYVREFHMRAFNLFFARAAPDLRPTAGYAVDASRWLEETRDLRLRLGIPDVALIRNR